MFLLFGVVYGSFILWYVGLLHHSQHAIFSMLFRQSSIQKFHPTFLQSFISLILVRISVEQRQTRHPSHWTAQNLTVADWWKGVDRNNVAFAVRRWEFQKATDLLRLTLLVSTFTVFNSILFYEALPAMIYIILLLFISSIDSSMITYSYITDELQVIPELLVGVISLSLTFLVEIFLWNVDINSIFTISFWAYPFFS